MGFACIDIGTVTCRLALWSDDPAQLEPTLKLSRICDLGRGVDATGHLSEDRVAAVLDCVRDYVTQAVDAGYAKACCTCTSAARDASNSDELLGELQARGLVAQVIPGKVEGSLTFLGVAQDFPGECLLVADNGGGSTEFAWGMLDEQTGLDLKRVRSIDVGCRRVTERFLSREDPPSVDDLRAAHEFAAGEFAPVGAWWTDHAQDVPRRLVVTGGTSTTIVALSKALVPYDSAQVHLAQVTRAQVREQEDRLAALPAAARAELAGIQSQRAPVILGGVVAVAEVMDATGFQSLTVSESDLLFGMALTAAATACDLPSPVGWRPKLS